MHLSYFKDTANRQKEKKEIKEKYFEQILVIVKKTCIFFFPRHKQTDTYKYIYIYI